MSNVNDYEFAKKLGSYKIRVVDAQASRVEDAKKIMDDPNYNWPSAEAKETAQKKYDSFKASLAFYQDVYDSGLKLTVQHENLVNLLAKWYNRWREDVSNEGVQEKELMSMQADLLSEIFCEMYKELKDLNLEIKAPKGLNLK